MEDILIRHYRQADRQSVRDIAWNTAFAGSSAGAFFGSKEVLASFLTEYFTDYEPQSCFVAESRGDVVGYLLGAKDSRQLEHVFGAKILPGIIIKFIFSGAAFNFKNLRFILYMLASFLKREFRMPISLSDYPATLHINLKEGFRNLGIGSKLMADCLAYLHLEKVPGVHLATMSWRAADFFRKQGFSLLYRGKRSYLRYLVKRDLPIYIFGKNPL